MLQTQWHCVKSCKLLALWVESNVGHTNSIVKMEIFWIEDPKSSPTFSHVETLDQLETIFFQLKNKSLNLVTIFYYVIVTVYIYS